MDSSFDYPTGKAVMVSVPATSTSPGQPGNFALGGGFVYFCIAVNQWRRVTLEMF